MATKKDVLDQFTDRLLKNLKESGYFSDGRGRYGLHCWAEFNSDGDLVKYFRQNLTLNGERIVVGLGKYPDVSLQDARDKAHDNWKKARGGTDPRKARRKVYEVEDKIVLTFNQVAELVISERLKKWHGTSSEDNWRGELKRHVYPVIGYLPIGQVTEQHLSDILGPLSKTNPPTAKSVLSKLNLIFEWCEDNDCLEDNPVTDRVRRPVSRSEHQTEHYRYVPYYEIFDSIQLIREHSANVVIKLALEFQIYTAVRHKSIRIGEWREIDWEREVWVIPAEHMKMQREHRVPLNAGALAVLKKIFKLRRPDSNLIFPSPGKGKVIYASQPSLICRELNLAGTPHGFRGSFATWCADKGVPQEITEAALDHRPSAIVQAYTHTDYLERRKPVMQAWADEIAGKLPQDWRFREGDDAVLYESYLESQRLLAEGQATIASMAATMESMAASMAEMAAEMALLRAA